MIALSQWLHLVGIFAKFFAIIFLWQMRKRSALMKYLGILFTALTLEQVIWLIIWRRMPIECRQCLGAGPRLLTYLAFGSDLIRDCAVIIFVLYLLGLVRNGHSTPTE